MTDIDNFIKFLNTDSNKTKKRKNAELMDEEEIVQGLYNSAFSFLWDLSQQLPKNIKGDELSELLGTLKKKYQYQMNANKKNKQIIEEEPEVVRLLLIAISSICVKLLTKINKYVLKNKTKTFLQCINAVSKEMGYNINDKKPKIIFETTQLDEEVEEEDDYGDNDDDDGSDDSEEEEEEEEERPIITTLTRRDEKEFLELVYKNDTNDIDEVLLKYYSKLPVRERANVMNNIKDIKNFQSNVKPMLFQIMELPLPMNQKNHILKAYNTLTNSRHNDNKLRNWFESLMTIPFGKYKGINLDSIETTKVKTFIDNLQSTMDNAVYGHDEAKRHIIQLMGQQIRNPKSKGNILGIYGVPGNGKCFALDTPILMHNGTFKKVQDVVVGDIVMGDDSRPRNVLSLGRGVDDMYEIKSNKGESYTVNSEHILCLKTSGLDRIIKTQFNTYKTQYFDKTTKQFKYKSFKDFESADTHLKQLLTEEKNDIVEITVKDYLKLSNKIKPKLKGYKVGVDFPTQQVDFDPYIIGFWLGDGASSGTKITTQDSTVLSYLRTELKKYNLNLNYISKYDYSIICDTKMNTRTKPNKFMNALNKYELINNKHIPTEYKVNDRQTRLKILAGLIDSDGYYNKTMKNFEITFKSRQLSNDLLYLARSLGFAAYQYEVIKGCMYNDEYKEGTYYRIMIYGDGLDKIPTLCPRKQYVDSDRGKNALVSGITVISKGTGNYYGFTLDGNNRFLLGDFTVTHNTTIIKEGIAKAMDKPFVFISLGGATDSSFLEGHSYTYEGSIYGRIVNGLISSKCMDPIIYFDELDKISKTPKGEEITNILVHLTDPVQNCHFRDKYFHGIDIDLSRATIIFSFNDPDNVNPILMDRITTVETKYLLSPQKVHIANNYLLKEIMKEMGLKDKDVILSEKVLEKIISGYTREGGVRKLKSLLYNIVRELNIANLLKVHIGSNLENRVKFPFVVKEEHLKALLKDKSEIEPEKIHTEDKVGVMNGLWANSYGNGGILEIQSLWIPTTVPYEVRATGNLQQVIKESTQVASSIAFNILTKKQQAKYLSEWKTRPQGIHLHFPDGATPKDGPSAGGALAVTIYSLLANKKIRHDVAMTGEINFQGKITAIGGLENKLEGAKRAGVKLALYPKENQKDMDKIYERNPSLVDGTFKVMAIETLEQAIQQTIVE